MKFFPTKKQVTRVTNYLLLGGAVFALGLIYNLPYERIQDSFIRQIYQRTGYQLAMETLSPAFPVGFFSENMHILGPSFGAFPIDFEFSSAKITFSPFSLITYPIRKTVSGSYVVQRPKEKWEGSFDYGMKKSFFEVTTKNLLLNHSFPLSNINPGTAGDLRISSLLSFDVNIGGETPALSAADLSASDGSIKFEGTKVLAEDSSGMFFKTLKFEKINIDAQLVQGTLNVKSISFDGPSVNVKASGTIKLMAYLPGSQISIDAKLTVNESEKYLRTLFSLSAGSLGTKMDENGNLALKIKGTFDQPSFQGY